MTEQQYQNIKKLMQKASYIKGQITTAKIDVARYSHITDSFKEKMEPERSVGPEKMLRLAIERLAYHRKNFAELKIPE